MLKNKLTLDIEKNGRNYTFFIEPSAPLGEIHDVLLEMREYVSQKIKDILESQKTGQFSAENSVETKA